MKKFVVLTSWAFLLMIVPTRLLHAHDTDQFQNNISTEVLSQLRHGPNAFQFIQKKMVALVRTETPVTLLNMSSVSTHGLLFAQYRSPKGMIDLELRVNIEKQQMETNYTPSQIDAIVYEWEQIYAVPAPLKALQPKLKRLTFHEGKGLHYDCAIRKKFDYILTFDIGWDEQQKKLENLLPDLGEVKKFVSSIESDSRGRLILENNKSGLPAFIALEHEEGGSRFIHMHHPLHDILFNRDTKAFSYAYTDDVSAVSKLPEIKRLLDHPEVRKFVFEKPETVRVNAEGSPKTGFTCVFIRSSSGEKLTTRLEGKKVTLGNGM